MSNFIDQYLIIDHFQNMSQVQIIPTGASPAVGFKMRVNGEDLFGKAYFRGAILCSDAVQGLEYERRVYEEVIPDIADKCPNFIRAKGVSVLSDYSTVGFENLARKIYEKMVSNKDPCIDPRTGRLVGFRLQDGIIVSFTQFVDNMKMMVEYLGGKSKGIRSRPGYYPQQSHIAIQVVMALLAMKAAGLQHNDLHSNNIIVQQLAQPEDLVYDTSEGSYTIQGVTLKVYMFDWDFAYAEKLGPNPKVSAYSSLGIKNQLDPRFDFFTFFCMFIPELSKVKTVKGVRTRPLLNEWNQDIFGVVTGIVPKFAELADKIFSLQSSQKPAFACRLLDETNPNYVNSRRAVPDDILEELVNSPYFQSVLTFTRHSVNRIALQPGQDAAETLLRNIISSAQSYLPSAETAQAAAWEGAKMAGRGLLGAARAAGRTALDMMAYKPETPEEIDVDQYDLVL